MKPARSSVAVQELSTRPRTLAPVDDELRFDFEAEPTAPSPRPVASFVRDGHGVKAAILRWLEEQA